MCIGICSAPRSASTSIRARGWLWLRRSLARLESEGSKVLQGPEGPPALFPQVKAWSADAISYRGDVVTHGGGTWQARKDRQERRIQIPIELAIPLVTV